MRTTILTRSVVALATLAVGSVALAATPANAAAANGVTHDQVITAVNGVRAAEASGTNTYSAATTRALRAIVVRSCDVITAEDEYAYLNDIDLVNAGDDADGLLITAGIQRGFQDNTEYCTIAAFATTDGSFQLSGKASITGVKDVVDPTTGQRTPTPVTLLSTPISGDAFVTAPVYPRNSNPTTYDLVASASGNAVKTTKVTTSKKVADKKSKSEKKAAKKAYSKRLKSAKKSYAKALDKAGKSKSKKAAAKKAYSKKRTAAKAKYRTAIADFRIVESSRMVTETPRAFSITTPVPSDSQR
jgi:hypothetical protein